MAKRSPKHLYSQSRRSRRKIPIIMRDIMKQKSQPGQRVFPNNPIPKIVIVAPVGVRN